jgi:tetratricopeptide (TPR) repeat protein
VGRAALGFFLMLVAFSWLPVPASLAADRCEPWAGQLVSAQGRVEARRVGTARWQPVSSGEVFCPGDSLRVEALSRAAVLLRTETTLRLDQRTTITFPAIAGEQPSWLDLLEGAVHFISRRPRALQIKTPFVNAAIEGTEFVLRVGPDQTELWVFEGRVLASNEAGSLFVVSGEAAVAKAGEPPTRRLVVRPRDAVQWALYYPPLIDYRTAVYEAGSAADTIGQALERYRQGDLPAAFARLEEVPDASRDAPYFTLRAGLLLSVGRVDEAGSDISQALSLDPDNGTALALKSVVALAQNEKEQALDLARQAVEREPRSPVPRIALSYVQQAGFEIEAALESVEAALKLDPDNALAWARLAELRLSMGDLGRAVEAAQQAVARNPDLARTHMVLGFAHLTRIEIDEAKNAFEKAIALDQADPLPRLGLGLAKIRENKLEAGRQDIELATSLDPNDSLIRSYMGKAYFEERRDALAGSQLAMAKELDPEDPTPWFYDAIRKQLDNRPVDALRDLERSIELNDKRAVYRSRLLLDEDLAMRSASLARIYDDLGFDQLALIEGTKSLGIDPADHSAHRFLSDTYATLPRHEIARVSELLQAQLLQPININPVQPRLAETDLNILAGAGPAEAAFNEFTPLFVRDQVQFTASGVAGNNNTLGDEAVLSGVSGLMSYSLGQFHYETDGFRENNDLRHDIYDLFGQIVVTPEINLQAEFRYRKTEHGDLALNFDPDVFAAQNRLEKREQMARLGARYAPSPQSDVVISLIYNDGEEEQAIFFDETRFDLRADERGYQTESQYIYRAARLNLTAGAGAYRTDVDSYLNDAPFQSFEREGYSAYGYANVNLSQSVTSTLGLTYAAYEQQDFDVDRLNPKLGLQWSVTDYLRVRLAGFKTVKQPLLVQQTIEPVQVAGFNQLFDDLNGTKATRYGAGVDARLGRGLWLGLETSRRDLEVPIGIGQPVFETQEHREELHRAYVYWTPDRDWAVRAEYQFDKFKVRSGQYIVFPPKVETTSVPIAIRYFSPSRAFAELGATYVRQEVDLPPTDSSDFVVVDAALGYRLPKRRGIISLEGRNLLDRNFQFQDDSYRTSETRTPRFIPSRTVFARITLNF